MRVSLFVTCFNDTLFPQAGRATVRLLESLGCEVDFPLEQTCCGQMHMNSGYTREGVALARRFARVFKERRSWSRRPRHAPGCCASTSSTSFG